MLKCNALRFDSLGVAFVTPKNQVLTLEFYFLYFYTMQKKCNGLVIAKGWLEKHYPKEYGKLNELLGADWYIYQYYTIYYLVSGECETSFISLKLELDSLIDGIEFGFLLAKHGK